MQPWSFHATGNPASPPTLFLHGFMGTGADWLDAAGRFAGRSFCILPDLPGHGANPHLPDAPLNFDVLAEGVIDLLDRQKLARVNLVGYSMGGRIALYTALQRPERVAALVLEGANPGLSAAPERRARAQADAARAQAMLSEGMDAFVEGWYELGLFASLHRHPRLLAQVKAKRKKNDPRMAARVIQELSPGRLPSLWDRLSELTMPVLLLAGELDAKYAALVSKMAAKIPGARVAIIPDAGHNTHLENPAAFAAVVGKRLESGE